MPATPATRQPLAASAGLQTMAPAMAEAANYYRWIADVIGPAVGQRVLDVGGGRGTLLARFLDRERLYAVDLAPDAVAHLREAYRDQPHFAAREGDITDLALQQDYIAEGVDTILCTNVLEHVEDDRAMLAAFAAILRPSGDRRVGGRLALQVPSHPWLYGSLDAAAGHFRRYRRGELREKLATAGFRVERLVAMNALAIPGWWWAGRVRRQGLADSPATNSQVRFYDRWLIPVARRMEAILPPPVGLSWVVLAQPRSTPAPARM